MKEIFLIIRFPVYLIALCGVCLYTVPIAILGFILAPVILVLGWLWFVGTSPFILVWSALKNDEKSWKRHWELVEDGVDISKAYEGIIERFNEPYISLGKWLKKD